MKSLGYFAHFKSSGDNYTLYQFRWSEDNKLYLMHNGGYETETNPNSVEILEIFYNG